VKNRRENRLGTSETTIVAQDDAMVRREGVMVRSGLTIFSWNDDADRREMMIGSLNTMICGYSAMIYVQNPMISSTNDAISR
jgi:hypothetical protein